jgi:hypothetical protein
MVEEEFLRDRVRLIRDLAEKADPFIKRRLTDLANNYDARLGRLKRHPVLDSSQAKWEIMLTAGNRQ